MSRPPAPLAILRRNRDAVALFAASRTQWRYAGMAGTPVGLDYAGAEAAARMAGITVTADLFGRLRVMEAAALAALAEKQ